VLVGGNPVLQLERGAKALALCVDIDDPRLPTAIEALAEHVASGKIRRIALEKVDGAPAVGSQLEPLLVESGFRQGPTRLIAGG
jgi:ATP-dependent Lhr-like helicase